MELWQWLAGGVAVAGVTQGWLFWRASRALAAIPRLEEKVARLGEALTLLTDTTESAFQAVASEMAKTPAATRRAAAGSAGRTRRVARAAGRGQSVTEIASREEMSEGEVRLRLHLANDAPPATKAARKKTTGTRTRAARRQEERNGAVRLG